jgi:hypothetical protein
MQHGFRVNGGFAALQSLLRLAGKSIVFVNRREDREQLDRDLNEAGLPSLALSTSDGQKAQERLDAYTAEGKYYAVVATINHCTGWRVDADSILFYRVDMNRPKATFLQAANRGITNPHVQPEVFYIDCDPVEVL